MALFNTCYAPGEEGEEIQSGCGQCPQSGLGLVGVGAFEPLLQEFKKSLLTASASVLRKLRSKQVGSGKVKKVKKRKAIKPQKGAGHKKTQKKQKGAGRKKAKKQKKQ
jgi:hypothetical protein